MISHFFIKIKNWKWFQDRKAHNEKHNNEKNLKILAFYIDFMLLS